LQLLQRGQIGRHYTPFSIIIGFVIDPVDISHDFALFKAYTG